MATSERKRTLSNRPPAFPQDFGERLEELKEMSGLSWGEFAERLDVSQTGLRKWRRGGPPSGAYFWAIIRLAREIPGGCDLILADTGIEVPALSWPEDFTERLARLEELSGNTLEEFALAFGLPEARAEEWRSGGMPTTYEVWAMTLWACRIPGGEKVLLAPSFKPRPDGE